MLHLPTRLVQQWGKEQHLRANGEMQHNNDVNKPVEFQSASESSLKSAPAKSSGILYEPSQIGAQRVNIPGHENVLNEWIRYMLEKQKKLIEMLTEHHTVLMKQMGTQRNLAAKIETENREEMGSRTWISGPAPIKIQKMGANDHPEAI